jgi:hypothetical protein
MDFFERWFHISPDSGDGTIEAAYLAVVFVVVSALVWYFAVKKLRGCNPTLPGADSK